MCRDTESRSEPRLSGSSPERGTEPREEEARASGLSARLEAALTGPAEAEAGATEQTRLARALTDFDTPASARCRLDGVRLLYVGGRPSLLDSLTTLPRQFGGLLLRHDGGIDDAVRLLPGLVSRYDAALLPADCVSHAAMTTARRICAAADMLLRPLRSATESSFLCALKRLGDTGAS